jgi:hypothetical protein
VHALRADVVAARYNQREQARGLGELRDELRQLQATVAEMTKADEIADAVALALEQRRSHFWTASRKTAAAVAALVLAVATLIPAAQALVGWL